MNASDILKYGHQTVMRGIERLPETDWETSGVCGWWSVKDIIAHLASFEHMLVDVLNGYLEGGPTPTLDVYRQNPMKFNDDQVAQRNHMTCQQVLADYGDTHTRNMELVARIPAETLRRAGTLPWYGMEYALDDFIVYTFYGHKREHTAQVAVFRDQIKR